MDSKQTSCNACHGSPFIHVRPLDAPVQAVANPEKASVDHQPPITRDDSATDKYALGIKGTVVVIIIMWTIVALNAPVWDGAPGKFAIQAVNRASHCLLGQEAFLDERPSCHQAADWVKDIDPENWHHHEFEHYAYLTYTLPTSSDLLQFVSNGSLSVGKFDVIDAGSDESEVSFNVTIGYHTDDVLGKIRVCKLQEDNSDGVGIFSPRIRGRVSKEDTVFFHVTVKLPSTSYHNFKTKLIQFEQYFYPLKYPIQFDSVGLHGINAPIYIQSILANHTAVSNMNADIWGSFNATDSITIKTLNAKIQVAVYLTHSGDADVAELALSNANGLISSDIFLYTPSHDDFVGKYNVTAKNANAPNQLRFRDAPVDSILNVTSKTAMGESYVKLHETFEGAFKLQTTPFHDTTIDIQKEKVEDPAGKGREREVKYSMAGRGTASGTVAWVGKDGEEDEEKEVGNVEVSTAFGPVKLVL